MIRFAIKNLWARRRSNAWLFAELIIITIVAWVVVDPVVVSLYDLSRPYGYERDRLVSFSIEIYDKEAPEYDANAADSATMISHYYNILREIREIPEVELAVPMRSWYGPEKLGTNYIQVQGKDTIDMVEIDITPMENYFSTLGFTTPEGMPTVQQLDTMVMADNDYVITQEMARRLFPDENPIGKKFQTVWSVGTDNYNRVVGVVNDFRFKGYQNNNLYGLHWNGYALPPFIYFYSRNYRIIAKLRPGVDPASFVASPDLAGSIESGNFYCTSAITLEEAAKKLNKQVGVTDSLFLSTTVLIFFLACLLLGVIGIFWLQTRARSEEAGVMKSFGARASGIVMLLLTEGWILTVTAWCIGCIIYLQYLVAEGFDNSGRHIFTSHSMPYDWVSDFTRHFSIISVVVLALLLVVVTIGVLIPARKIANVNPVEALRDE